MAKRGRTRRGKKASQPVNYNVPGFSASHMDRETAKKNVMSKLKRQGIEGHDATAAYDRGKLTQDSSTGKYTFSTNAMSIASPAGRDVPLPKSK